MLVIRWLQAIFIRLIFSAQMAGHGVLANPLRSTLTILGVAIGVASVVSLMGIGEGARQAVVRQFESLGTNVIVLSAHDESVEFVPGEAEELVARVAGMELATPVLQTEARVTWRRTRGTVGILGVNEQFPHIRDYEIVAGNFFTSLHVAQRAPVCVLGYNIGSTLLGGRNPSGQTLIIDGQTYRIVGVLEPKGDVSGDDIDNMIIIPYTTAQRIAEKRTVPEIWAKAGSAREADLVVVQLGRIYRRQLGLDGTPKSPVPVPEPGPGPGPEPPTRPAPPIGTMSQSDRPPGEQPPDDPDDDDERRAGDLITITNLNQLVREADQANRIMTLLLGGIAAVSLLVGGLGIMNIMLVAVTERTSEIGLRRAIGAKQSDLIVQFILEALYLSATGAIAGVMAGIWGLGVFAQYGFDTAISLQSVQVAVGVALAAGLLFGVYPALSASAVSPVQALRR